MSKTPMVDLEMVEKLYDTISDPSQPAREIFKAEYDLTKLIPVIISEIKSLRETVEKLTILIETQS